MKITLRWIINLQQSGYTIKHIEREINPTDYISCNINNTTEFQNKLFSAHKGLSDENIKSKQYKDENLLNIIQKITNK